MISIDTKRNTFIRHAIFWIIWWIVQSFLMGGGKSLILYLPKEIAMVSLQALVVYINWFILYPYLFKNRKWLLYGFLSVGLVYVVFVLSFSWITFVLNAAHSVFEAVPVPDFPDLNWQPKFWRWFSASVPYSLALVGSLAVKIFLESKEAKEEREKLQFEKQRLEVTYLRNQINPHFLFNALNNIHALILKDSEKASEYTLALSEVMRHMLYEIKNDEIPLERETACVQNLFNLIKMRKGGSNIGHCTIDIENNQVPIAPLLICSIVENGIKHSGIEYTANVELDIKIIQAGDRLEVSMHNSIHSDELNNNGQDVGIGLDNLRKRLALTYPERYHFTFQIEDGKAFTKLELNLS